jgi:replicative DNA helicase
MSTSHSDAVEHTERALLGVILEDNALWPQTSALSTDDFSLDTHRKLYARTAAMFEDQRPVDLITLTEELARLNQLEG